MFLVPSHSGSPGLRAVKLVVSFLGVMVEWDVKLYYTIPYHLGVMGQNIGTDRQTVSTIL